MHVPVLHKYIASQVHPSLPAPGVQALAGCPDAAGAKVEAV
jgi:hypothetical protein